MKRPVVLLLASLATASCQNQVAPLASQPGALQSARPSATAGAVLPPGTGRLRPPSRRGNGALAGDSPNPGEGPAELAERLAESSPHAPTEAGLRELCTELLADVRSGAEPELSEFLSELLPRADALSLAFTYEGGGAMVPYLAGPAGTPLATLRTQLQGWATDATLLDVLSATGAEVAANAPNAQAISTDFHLLGALLRPQVRWYLARFRKPDGSMRTLGPFVYVGAHWFYVPEPWRFAPGQPGRGTVTPAQPGTGELPVVLPAAPH